MYNPVSDFPTLTRLHIQGLSGAVTSVAPTSSLVASAAEDRYVRLHTSFPPPSRPGDQQDRKVEVIQKTYVDVVPTVVLWDGHDDASLSKIADPDGEAGAEDESDDDDDVWNEMEDAEQKEIDRRKKSKAR